MRDLKIFLAASAASVGLIGALVAPAQAQETTSAVSGQVTDDTGAPLPGAKVVVVHTPSGTTSSSTSDGSGSFGLRGLRVGGPYTVTVTAPGYAEQRIEGVALTVGDTVAIPVQMTQDAIIVTAASAGSRDVTLGSQSSFGSDEIKDIVSARRDVRDIVRRDPLAAYNPNVGGVTIAGGNIRTQRFSVDGVQMQDSFGLNYGGLPSTRGIVSIEAIEQLTVKAAPFDISEGNFQGGAVNVVLKSGNNEFHASAFSTWGGSELTGDITRFNRVLPSGSKSVNKSTILDFHNWGGSLSGPLIKDKLFFSAAYEKLTEGAANTFGTTDGSAANSVPGLTSADVQKAIGAFDAAGYDDYNIGTIPTALSEKDIKYSAKLDWNITDGHRLSVSYIHHENELPNFASGAATGSTSTSAPYIQLQSNQYKLTEFTNAVSGQLNSQWSDAFSTEVRVAYKYYKRGQVAYFGADYAQFAVCLDPTSQGGLYNTSPGGTAAALCSTGPAGSIAESIVRMGPDTPRQANLFDNQQTTVNLKAQLAAGNHTFKLQADYFHSTLYNLFVYGGSSVSAGGTGGANGGYYFDSLEDFSNRMANELSLATTTTGNKADGYVDWAYDMYTVGLQDTWRPSNKIAINAGLRYDFYASRDTIAPNQNFSNRYALLYPGVTNTATMDGRDKLQPRFGFNWTPDRSLRIAGGAGLFAGGISDVFISNNYSNSGAAINATGASITSVDILRTGGTPTDPTCLERSSNVSLPTALCAAVLNNVTGGSIPQALFDYIKANAGVSANAYTNSLDPNFKVPAQWKYNLSAQWKPQFGDSWLTSGWSFRADLLMSKAQQALRWTDLRAQPLVVAGVVQIAPDGRPRYGGLVNGVVPGSNYDVQLTNTKKGKSWVWSLGAAKDIGNDFRLSASYTHQNVKDVAGVLVSSSVNSSYGIPTSDPNSGGDYGRSMFEVKHTLRANFDFKHNFFGDNETRFGFNWELRSGQPFSVTMNDFTTSSVSGGRAAVFGTQQNTTAHLFYVPDFSLTPSTDGLTYGIVSFDNITTRDAVMGLVKGTKLSQYQGKIAPKNVFRGPWYNKVDLNLAQQLPFFMGGKITALLSIENFLNLLDKSWGSYQDYGVSQTIVRVACKAAAAGAAQTCPGYTYSAYAAPTTSTAPKYSLYAIRAGLRLDF